MKYTFIALVVVVVGLGVVLDNVMRIKPRPTEELKEISERLTNEIPMVIGQWEGEDIPMDEAELKASSATGHLQRVYTHRDTGEFVLTMVVCGVGREIAIHTPDACYQASGFDMEDDPHEHVLECPPAGDVSFLTTRFYKESEGRQVQKRRIHWTFSTGNEWEAATWPEARYVNDTVLVKVYIHREAGEAASDERSPCTRFARDFMPVLSQILFEPQPEETTPADDSTTDEAPAEDG